MRAFVEIGKDRVTMKPYDIIDIDDERFSEDLRVFASDIALETKECLATDFLGFLFEKGIEPVLQ